MYAIIENGGKQYKVSEGDTVDGGSVKVGEEAKSAKVTAKVEAQDKFRKIVVFKYKAKKNERKKQGHRQPFTAVKIEKITV